MTILGLGVSNLETSNHFYENIFGWKKLDSSNEFISFFKLNGVLLSLYPREKLAEDATISPEGSGFKSFSIAYNTRSENEVDELISELKSKGVKIIKEPEKVFWGGYSSYIADPDDNLWEIAFNPFLSLNKYGSIE
jgi:catechol 2,3-dioxygenase-like lactoylglutathione lyase family enzyme